MDFDSLYNSLKSSLCKRFDIVSFQYTKENGFEMVLSYKDMSKITTADIIIFNHKTKQYRTFKYISGDKNTKMIFEYNNILFTISQ